MGTAPRPAPGALEISAGNVKHRVGIQVALRGPETLERDVLRVAQEPRRLVIQRGSAFAEFPDPEEHTQTQALRTQPGAGRQSGAGLDSG
jgi:hypothetical protein